MYCVSASISAKSLARVRDIFGDGVNIAARLEAMAEPGGICISGKVQEEVRGKVDCALEDMGEQTLKNIDRPVRAYRVRTRAGEAGPLPAETASTKHSIAVLPFAFVGLWSTGFSLTPCNAPCRRQELCGFKLALIDAAMHRWFQAGVS